MKKDCWVCEHLKLVPSEKPETDLQMVCGKTNDACGDVCEDFELWEVLKESDGRMIEKEKGEF